MPSIVNPAGGRHAKRSRRFGCALLTHLVQFAFYGRQPDPRSGGLLRLALQTAGKSATPRVPPPKLPSRSPSAPKVRGPSGRAKQPGCPPPLIRRPVRQRRHPTRQHHFHAGWCASTPPRELLPGGCSGCQSANRFGVGIPDPPPLIIMPDCHPGFALREIPFRACAEIICGENNAVIVVDRLMAEIECPPKTWLRVARQNLFHPILARTKTAAPRTFTPPCP